MNLESIFIAILVGTMAIQTTNAGDDRLRLRCDAEGVRDISMDGRYEERRNRAKFDASFEAAPGGNFSQGDVLPVMVAGIEVGSMELIRTVNGDLEGDLEFDTRRDEGNPFPNNFPQTGEGTSVMVGPLGCDLDN